MLKRKITEQMKIWRKNPHRNPLVIKGVRQCGKTFSVQEFAHAGWEHVVSIDFFQNPEYGLAFAGSLDIDTIVLQLTAMLGTKAVFEPGKTVLVLDEIQDCPDARTALKFFKQDGRFDVIATGSLLGVHGYGNPPKSIPVGYEDVLEMHPLDFEEFLWANGVSGEVISLLRESLQKRTAVPAGLHERMKNLFLQYAVIGGMPAVVERTLETRSMAIALKMQRSICSAYSEDMVKYASRADKSRIRECFLSIPKQLAKENKKFQYSAIRSGGRASQYAGCIQWIEDAGIIQRCYNLASPELPLSGNSIESIFKVYMADTGLFTSMLDDGTQADILQGNLLGYKGAIFENLIADVFCKMHRRLYYFRKDSGLEVDFVIRYRGEATLVEVKATTGKTKSTKTILSHPEKYHIRNAIKLGDYNVGEKDGILTLPSYMAFLLTDL